ncbi:MAG TPA: selenide, water dikinase SelD [Gaiellaceae bacterium]|jgi:selenide,water dikinase
MATTSGVRLTEYSSCGGCAAKYSAALLQELVSQLPVEADPNLLVGLAPSDDAAVYRLDDERALAFTVDFFPPIVDDPADYGAIAAANALNDIYAMGATPLVALSVAAFPEALPAGVVSAVFEGAAAKVREGGAVLAGGHTLRDEEPLYGLAVVGTLSPDAIWTKGGAQPGDELYLTKPLGTGLVVHGRKEGRVDDETLAPVVAQMKTLNQQAARELRELGPHAVTDVTGFGLIGHAYELATRSGVRVELAAGALPVIPAAAELAAAGIVTGGEPRNRDYVGEALIVDGAGDVLVRLALDPQTAGGLLVALAPDTPFRAGVRIGTVAAGEGVRLHA